MVEQQYSCPTDNDEGRQYVGKISSAVHKLSLPLTVTREVQFLQVRSASSFRSINLRAGLLSVQGT